MCQAASQMHQDSYSEKEKEQAEKQQYVQHAYSPKIMTSLAPSVFLAILCVRQRFTDLTSRFAMQLSTYLCCKTK